MINDVKKIGEFKFLINDAIIVSILDVDIENGINISVSYDIALVTEQEATEIADKFVNEALEAEYQKEYI